MVPGGIVSTKVNWPLSDLAGFRRLESKLSSRVISNLGRRWAAARSIHGIRQD